MKVVAISHSCVTDVNQQLYVALNALPDVSVELVIPSHWKSEYSGESMQPRLLPDVRFPVYRLPVGVPGHISLYYFKPHRDRIAVGSAHEPAPPGPSSANMSDANAVRTLRQLLRHSRPDIVFLDEEPWSLSAAQVAGCCRQLRIPYVCYTKQNIYKRYPLPFRMLERRIYTSARAIIALSEEVRDVLRKKGYDGPCPLLAHACDLALFSPQDSRPLRARLGTTGIVVGYMGRFVPEKGLDTLVLAVGALKKKHPEVPISLLMVGSGQEEANLRQLATSAGIANETIFAGVVPHREAGNYLNCMDVFVLPSRTTPGWKEQFGRVIVEALACGVPVVGSNSGQIPFLIEDTGGGLVFREGDTEHLTEQLERLAVDENLRSDLGNAGKFAVESRYTYPAIANELAVILRDTLNK